MTRLIKKYKNRRLYDTEKSQYITMDDLQRYVIEGIPFHVEDSNTGRDITNATLLQILVEMEATSSQFLSKEALRHLITLANHPMNQSLKTMLEQMVAMMESQLNGNPYVGDYQNTQEIWNKQMQQFISQWQNFFKK